MIRQQLLNDLRWAIQSPSLVSETKAWLPPDADGSAERKAEASFDFNQVDADRLVDFMGNLKRKRVGRYFERLILFWLKFCRRFEILSAGQQIQEAGQTVGEIDVMFRDQWGRVQHWETAIKFYLDAGEHLPERHDSQLPDPQLPNDPPVGDPPVGDDGPVGALLGPNARDAFDYKMKRLFEHQLRLSERCSHRVDIRRGFVKGRIFYHFHGQDNAAKPPFLSPDHLRAKWLYHRELSDFVDIFPGSYRVLTKPFWLADDERGQPDVELMDDQEMVNRIAKAVQESQRPRLLSYFHTPHPAPSESFRIFVVPNSWPR